MGIPSPLQPPRRLPRESSSSNNLREVQASVLATRLLWALGFVADRVYPVRVSCRGCEADPWKDQASHKGTHEFDAAVIERKPHGRELWEGDRKAGWTWPELEDVVIKMLANSSPGKIMQLTGTESAAAGSARPASATTRLIENNSRKPAE